MVKYLLDSNALAEPLRPRPSSAFLRRFRQHAEELAISSLTWHEAMFGLERLPAGRRKQALHDFLWRVVEPAMDILAYDQEAAQWHARERARLEKRGRKAPFVDGQIAAIAAVRKLVLVTANVKDFRTFDGLAIENWLER